MKLDLNLEEELDFTDIDLTDPKKVIETMLNELPGLTRNMIYGCIQQYDGPVESYVKPGLASLTRNLSFGEEEINIQKELGELGKQEYKYECYLYTPENTEYRYRMFFMKYGISKYPVTITLELSIANSISNKDYICLCNNRQELEQLVENVLVSKRIISVMQELIRINQAMKSDKQDEKSSNVAGE